MNNKTLLLILVGLLAIYGLNKVFSGKKERSFQTELIQLDTAKVDRVVVFSKADEFQEIVLQREGDGWIITRGAQTAKALQSTVTGLLSPLTLIETKRIAAKKPDKWPEYEVEDGKATRLEVYEGSKKLTDFIIGRFAFNQQAKTATSFIRFNGEDEVYAVDGFLAMSLGQGFDSYRNKELVKLNKDDVTELTFTGGEEIMSCTKTNEGWVLNGATPLDSAAMDGYLLNLQNISGTEFANDFDEVQQADKLARTLTIKANNQLEPTVVQCYADTNWTKPFVIHSTQNPSGYFRSDTLGVFTRIFKRVEDVVPES